jgi:intein-encoded DNA endonuclease-like protein
MKILTPTDKASIIQLYKNRTALKEIRKMFQVAEKRIKNVISEAGLTIRMNQWRIKIDQNETKNVINLYQMGQSAAKIAKKYRVTYGAIIRILKENGITVRPPKYYFTKQFKESDIVTIKTKYLNGEKVKTIAKKFSVSEGVIYRILKEHKIEIRQSIILTRKYIIRENFFEKINSEKKAYFLGLLYADGCVSSYPKYCVSIGLQERDGDLLEEFKKVIFVSDKKLRLKKHKGAQNEIRLDIDCKKTHQDLINKGCVPRKSLILKWPTLQQVPEKFIRHFIRGYFDGDGSIYYCKSKKKFIADFVGGKNFINGLKKQLQTFEINSNVYDRGKINMLRVEPRKDFQNLYQLMYDNSSIFLKRKREKFTF